MERIRTGFEKMNSKNRRPLTASMIFIRAEEKVLLLERFKDPHKGYLVPPGGKVEAGEVPEAAAARELLEETGLDIKSMGLDLFFLGVMSEASPIDYNWSVFLFSIDLGEKFEPADCDEGILKWVDLSEIETMKIPESDFHIYRALKNRTKIFLQLDYDADLNIINIKKNLF
jgi:8-oxo-dGTP diphosphatase